MFYTHKMPITQAHDWGKYYIFIDPNNSNNNNNNN